MSQSPSELSDQAFLAMLQTSESTLEGTKIATSDVFNRLASFNDIFSQLETTPNKAALIYRAPASDRGEWQEIGGRLVVGRGPKLAQDISGATFKVADAEMSRQHFEIVRGPDKTFVINDCCSTNGLFVNGSKVNTCVLISGSAITAGKTTFFFVGP
jgi:hypothetical protein